MSARRVAFALAGTATGALLLIGAKGSQASDSGVPVVGGKQQADLLGVTSAGKPASGTYSETGPVVQTPFGPVQVEIKLANGKINDVEAVRVPTEHGLSVTLNAYAKPILRREVLTAQDAKIDVVSGATYTSDAYAQSLQAALNKAATRG
ncbi:MAG TPA: FMN-binding protein [Micromonosporaceae bacterium]